MHTDNSELKDYLVELHNQTQGNEEMQVSMHDVGSALGLDKNQAGAIGQDLIVEGLADLRTLAGGISITSQGIEMLQKYGLVSVSVSTSFQLSKGPVVNEADRQAIEQVVEKIKQAVSAKAASFEDIEEIVIDLKTIEVHLLSSKPKTAVIREIIRSIHDSLKRLNLNEVAMTLSTAK